MPYDYSKIKKWTAGAPDELEVGMVLHTLDRYEFVGTINPHSGVCDCCCLFVTKKEMEDMIIRWAWLPGFEPEGE